MYTTYTLAIVGAGLALAAVQPPPSPAISIDATMTDLPVLPSWISAAVSSVNEIPGVDISIESMPTAIPTALPSNFSSPATTASALPAATYQAVLPAENFAKGFPKPLTGKITISSSPSKPGVQISVDFHDFPSVSEYGPFIYHIHAAPVPEDGNCTATLKHLDPTVRGEKPPCMVADPASCQVGDLSGKHGNVTGTEWVKEFGDLFLSTDPESPAFFGDKSVVIHTGNATRITCANFIKVGGDGDDEEPPKEGPTGEGGATGPTTGHEPVSTATATSTSPAGGSTSSAPATQQTGSAGTASLGGMAVVAGLAAMVL